MKEIVKTFQEAQSILIVSHSRPDGDAIGSMLSLGLSLQRLGKNVVYYNQDTVPFNLIFLEQSKSIQQSIPNKHFDVTCIIDCNAPIRVSADFGKFKNYKKLIIIDHHVPHHSPCGDLIYIDPQAPAAGVLIYRIIQAMGINITSSIAEALYTTLLVDTGCFRYSNTTDEVFKLAQELVIKGAKPWKVSNFLYDSFPRSRLKALELALKTLEISSCGRYASIFLSRKTMEKLKINYEIVEGFINYPRSIDSVIVAVQFKEVGRNLYRISLRSKGNFDVSKIASLFDGGGHCNAAGLELSGSLSKVKKQLYDRIEFSLGELRD